VRGLVDRLGVGRVVKLLKPRVFVMGFPGTDAVGDTDDLNSEKTYSMIDAHAKGVIGNEALVLDGAERYPRVNFYGLNPGIIRSGIREGMLGKGSATHTISEAVIGMLFQSAGAYALRIAPLILSPDLEQHSGAMFNARGDAILASPSLTAGNRLGQVMDASEQLARTALAEEGAHAR